MLHLLSNLSFHIKCVSNYFVHFCFLSVCRYIALHLLKNYHRELESKQMQFTINMMKMISLETLRVRRSLFLDILGFIRSIRLQVFTS